MSCSPFRVPVARLAAAQAVLAEAEKQAPAKKCPATKAAGSPERPATT